jgi:hypothetical protein
MNQPKNIVEKMELPPNTNLPYFAYGLFKPGELAFNQIEEFIGEKPQKMAVNGFILVRDGLPLLKLGRGGEVEGYLINFKKGDSARAYDKICQFEPKEHYIWTSYDFAIGVSGNLLIGKSPDKGSIRYDKREWKAQDDPVFDEAMALVMEMANNYAINKFEPAPPKHFDWKRLFQLQMAYLFLWVALERFCGLAYGPNLKPGEKLKKLKDDLAFKDALKIVVKRTEKVTDSRNPEKTLTLNSENPSSSINYYYTIRSNLSHRGKTVWKDGEIVRLSLLELFEIFQIMLRYKGLAPDHDDKS